MTTAYLFSGQGAQYPAMGLDLYRQEPIFKATFDQASELLNQDLAAVLADDKLQQQTEFLQPTIVTFSVALYRLMQERLPKPAALLGLSLGEYSALIASGALDFATGLQLVQKRAKLMQIACRENPGAMVAVMNTPVSTIQTVCDQVAPPDQLTIANYNHPRQTVIGGTKVAIDAAKSTLKQQGVNKLIDLPVAGAFHTALMQSAADGLAPLLAATPFRQPGIPVYSNTTQQPFTLTTMARTLTQQMTQPTKFVACLEALQAAGVDQLIELGPGHTLTGFTRKTLRNVQTAQIDSVVTLEQATVSMKGV